MKYYVVLKPQVDRNKWTLITVLVACCGYDLAVWDGFGSLIGFRNAIDMDVWLF
jgi:hypothetical protein